MKKRWKNLVGGVVAAAVAAGMVSTAVPATAATTDPLVFTFEGSDFRLPLVGIPGVTVDLIVDWGDGSPTVAVTSAPVLGLGTGGDPDATHTYTTSGVHEVRITGTGLAWTSTNAVNQQEVVKLRTITEWGPMRPAMGFLSGASMLVVSAPEVPLVATTNLSNAFTGAAAFNAPIGAWDTSQVTNLSAAFWGASTFNQPIGTWDTSNVWIMIDAFKDAKAFNQDLCGWDTSHVRTMQGMFVGARSFNQNLSCWDTSNVTNMQRMFQGEGTWYVAPPLSDANIRAIAGWQRNANLSFPTAADGLFSRREVSAATIQAFRDANWPINAYANLYSLPAVPVVTSTPATTTSANLSWPVPPGGSGGITMYEIELPDGTIVQQQVPAAVPRPGAYTVTGLTPGVSATVKVRAVTPDGNGTWATVTVNGSPVAPLAAPVVTVAATTSTTGDISWTAPADGAPAITGYEITLPSGARITVPATTTTYRVTGLSPSSSNAVSVKAINAVGAGPAGTATIATTAEPVSSGGGASSGGAGSSATTPVATTPVATTPVVVNPPVAPVLPNSATARVIYRQVTSRGTVAWQPVVRVGKAGKFRYVKPKTSPKLPAGALVTVVTSGDPKNAPSRNVAAARKAAFMLASTPGVKVYDGTLQGKAWRGNARIIVNW